jgi:aminoglycoside phosphotransferase (APT) family kinase protein
MNGKSKVDEETAAAVLKHHFGKRPSHVERLHGGVANHVFEAKVGRQEVVVHISDKPEKLQKFQKEQWAVRQARAQKVPAPEILEVGDSLIGLPYMISIKLRGQDASACHNRIEVARGMGQYAARIHAIPTSGFGSVFDWSRNQLSRKRSWRSFLDEELDIKGRLNLLETHQMLTPAHLKKLRSQVRTIRLWKGHPSLTHGDLRLKNILLDDKGKICAVLDWENSTSNLAPYWEFSIALHDLSIDEKEAFLEGYGIKPREYARMAADIKALNILNYAGSINRALRHKDRAKLDRIRARLHGTLDLYCL